MSDRKRKLATIKDYKDLFQSPLGKKVLLDLCSVHNVFEPMLDENPTVMAQLIGEKNAVLRILKVLRTDMTKLNEEYEASEREKFAQLEREM